MSSHRAKENSFLYPWPFFFFFINQKVITIVEGWYIDWHVNSELSLQFSSLFTLTVYTTAASLQTLHLSVQTPTPIPLGAVGHAAPCQVTPLTYFPASAPDDAPEKQKFHHIQLSPLFD